MRATEKRGLAMSAAVAADVKQFNAIFLLGNFLLDYCRQCCWFRFFLGQRINYLCLLFRKLSCPQNEFLIVLDCINYAISRNWMELPAWPCQKGENALFGMLASLVGHSLQGGHRIPKVLFIKVISIAKWLFTMSRETRSINFE
jgi:hypothetical protein